MFCEIWLTDSGLMVYKIGTRADSAKIISRTLAPFVSPPIEGFRNVVKFIQVCPETNYAFTCQQTTTSQQWEGKLHTFVLIGRTNIVACPT